MSVLQGLVTILEQAGAAAMAHGPSSARAKQDGSPVTDADLASDEIISRLLPGLLDIPILSEETFGQWKDMSGESCWLVDPIDGTSDFVAGRPDWTVNIALIQQGVPVLGGVFAPAMDRLYLGEMGKGAHCRTSGTFLPIQTSNRIGKEGWKATGLRTMISVSHRDAATDEHMKELVLPELCTVGSSLKFCRIADGWADYYPRCHGLHVWDIAAGHAVVLAAGGGVYRFGTQEPILYSSGQVKTSPFQVY